MRLPRRALLAASLLAVPARAQSGELLFPAILPLTGQLALLGDEAWRGLTLAAEQRNTQGGVFGRPIRLIAADAPTPPQAQAQARRFGLAGVERAIAAFGTLETALSLAATQAAEVEGLPYIELLASGDAVTERGLRWLVRTAPRATDFAALAAEAVRALPLPAPGLLHGEGSAATALAAAVEARLTDAGTPPRDRASYGGQPPDLVAAVRRLRTAGTETILHAGRGDDPVTLFRALADEAWRPAVLGLGGGYALVETARAIGPDFAATLVVDLPQPDIAADAAPGAAIFAEAYRRRWGAEMRAGHSLAAYCGALLAFEALARAGGTEPARFRAALAATDIAERGLANGWGARFDERGQNQRARPIVLRWRDDRLVSVLPPEARP